MPDLSLTFLRDFLLLPLLYTQSSLRSCGVVGWVGCTLNSGRVRKVRTNYAPSYLTTTNLSSIKLFVIIPPFHTHYALLNTLYVEKIGSRSTNQHLSMPPMYAGHCQLNRLVITAVFLKLLQILLGLCIIWVKGKWAKARRDIFNRLCKMGVMIARAMER